MKKYIRATLPDKRVYTDTDLYHRLLNVSNHHRHQGTRDHADILISQYNTAGGPDLMKEEIDDHFHLTH